MQLNVNTTAVIEYSKKLDQMHKSALPFSIRGALNKAAFDVKQSTMPTTTSQFFRNRSKNFFKANSKVNMASGFNLSSMQSEVGFTKTGLNGENNYAVDDLEQQERGGSIQKKGFIPLHTARGGSPTSLVKPNNRLSKIKNIVRAKNAKGVNDKQRFVKSVYHAGKGGYVLAKYKNKEILWRVNSVNRTKSGAFKLTPLYTFKSGRKVSVRGREFMQKASIQSGSKMEQFYIQEANRQLSKIK